MGAKSSKEIDDLIKEKGLDRNINDLIEKKSKKPVKQAQPTDNKDGSSHDLPPYSSAANRLHASLRSTPPTYNGRHYTATVKSMPQKSRLVVDGSDPMLMSTLPPHLTSVFNTSRQHDPVDGLGGPDQQHQHRQTKDTNSNSIDSAWHNLNKIQINNRPTKSLMLEELLECPICMNSYDDPHVLPCQHTFCKGCIITLKGNNEDNRIMCPICRETHVLANGVDGLPANYTMKRLIELEAMKPVENQERVVNDRSSHHKHHESHNNLPIIDDQEQYYYKKRASKDPQTQHNSYYRRQNRKNNTRPVPHFTRSTNSINRTPESSYSSMQSPVRYQKRHQEIAYSRSEISQDGSRLKLILLCHSSAVDSQSDLDNRVRTRGRHQNHHEPNEVYYEDEYGRCKTFSKIGVMSHDRIEKLKYIVEEKFGIPYDEQLLVYKDKVLRNDLKQLVNYRLRNYSRIHIFDKRDVNENLSDIYSNNGDGNYYVDEELLRELTNSKSAQENKETTRPSNDNSKSKSKLDLRNVIDYSCSQTYMNGSDRRYKNPKYMENVDINRKRRDYDGLARKTTIIGKQRVRQLNELFEN